MYVCIPSRTRNMWETSACLGGVSVVVFRQDVEYVCTYCSTAGRMGMGCDRMVRLVTLETGARQHHREMRQPGGGRGWRDVSPKPRAKSTNTTRRNSKVSCVMPISFCCLFLSGFGLNLTFVGRRLEPFWCRRLSRERTQTEGVTQTVGRDSDGGWLSVSQRE
ncbi:unnamed protein product [Ectocarpus sp. 12 AP-2014]